MTDDDPFVPGYQNNVFISYASADNRVEWVSALAEYLDIRIGELLGTKARVWRDPKTRDGDVLEDRLVAEVDASAVFVTILSPSFIRSPYCKLEVERFRKSAAGAGVVDGSSRWISVVKTPFDTNELPPALRGAETIQARFYEDDTEADLAREFAPGTDEYDERAKRLAASICGLLEKMRRKVAPAPGPQAPRVFLAETTTDRRDDRRFILGDLGGNIVAPAELPTELRDLEAEVSRQLTGCALSIHVLGARYGVRPEGEGLRSVPRIQFDLASGARRLVWIPEEMPAVEAAQQEFLEEIENLEDPGLEVIRSGRQAFLEHARDVIKRLAEPPLSPALGRAIYLVSEMGDLEHPPLHDLANCLRSEGFFVEQPVYEGELSELQAEERRALTETDATIIYFGRARDAWIRSRRRQILHALGELNLTPTHCRAIYLCDPDTPVKRNVYMGLPGGVMQEMGGPPLFILGDCGTVECAKLTPLLRNLRGRKNG